MIGNENNWLRIIHLDTCDSTNDYLKSHLREMRDRLPLLLISDEQTKGRGQRNRDWFSKRDQGLYLSLALGISGKTNLNLLSLCAGVAVRETLNTISRQEFKLKWPNDIMVRNKKIAGILIENMVQGEEIICICGIGINLNHEKDDFPAALRGRSISMKMVTGNPTGSHIVIQHLVRNCFKWFGILEKGEESRILNSVSRSNYFMRGDPVSIQIGNGKTEGSFVEIRPDGGISIEKDTGEVLIFYTGETQFKY